MYVFNPPTTQISAIQGITDPVLFAIGALLIICALLIITIMVIVLDRPNNKQ